MSARAQMTMRATIERNVETGKDPLGHPLPEDWEEIAILPCWVWSSAKKFIDNANKEALLEIWKGNFQRAADITEADRITGITDRLGDTIFAGTFAIDTIQVKPQHLEILLRQVN